VPIGEDALANYAWSVEIDGQTLATFKELSGVSIEIAVIEHQENTPKGLPVLKKLPAQQKFGDITLKRGLTTDGAWWAWIKEVQQGKIDDARRNASIVSYDYAYGEKMRFNVRNAWPSKISFSPLQAGGTEVLVEEVVLVHEGIELA
jgi:phage tail-like protein